MKKITSILVQGGIIFSLFITMIVIACHLKSQNLIDEETRFAFGLQSNQNDTTVVDSLIQLAQFLVETEPDSLCAVERYPEQALFISEELRYANGMAIANYTLGTINMELGFYFLAQDHFRSTIAMKDSISDQILILDSYEKLTVAIDKSSEWHYFLSRKIAALIIIASLGLSLYIMIEGLIGLCFGLQMTWLLEKKVWKKASQPGVQGEAFKVVYHFLKLEYEEGISGIIEILNEILKRLEVEGEKST